MAVVCFISTLSVQIINLILHHHLVVDKHSCSEIDKGLIYILYSSCYLVGRQGQNKKVCINETFTHFNLDQVGSDYLCFLVETMCKLGCAFLLTCFFYRVFYLTFSKIAIPVRYAHACPCITHNVQLWSQPFLGSTRHVFL